MNRAVIYQSGNGNTRAVAETIANEMGVCAKKNGIKVNEHALCLKMYLKGHKIFGREGGKLSEGQRKKIEEFVYNVKKSER